MWRILPRYCNHDANYQKSIKNALNAFFWLPCILKSLNPDKACAIQVRTDLSYAPAKGVYLLKREKSGDLQNIFSTDGCNACYSGVLKY